MGTTYLPTYLPMHIIESVCCLAKVQMPVCEVVWVNDVVILVSQRVRVLVLIYVCVCLRSRKIYNNTVCRQHRWMDA